MYISDVVQSGRPIFDDFFQHLWPYIGNNTANVVFQMVKRLWLISHRPMTLHRPTENSLAVLNHKILEANSQVQNVKLGGLQTCLSINGTSCVTCCAVLLEPKLLDIMIVQFRNVKVSNHGSIPITINCSLVAFIVFEEVRNNDSTSP
ncbi:uncharacterized protein TNCV_2116931 [Trichonephila clavipes]|nr:uncharacterized protein TNCV_2116931 [Trichonephila clavipes]